MILTLWAILLTEKQTDKQPDRHRWKHNLLGEGRYPIYSLHSMYIWDFVRSLHMTLHADMYTLQRLAERRNL